MDFVRHLPPGIEDLHRGFPHDLLRANAPLRYRQPDFRVKLLVIEANGGGVETIGGKDNSIYSCPVGGSEAHRARLATGVEDAPFQSEGLQRRARRANGNDFRMRGGIVCAGYLIPSSAHDLTPPDNDCTKRPARLCLHMFGGEGDGLAHERFVAADLGFRHRQTVVRRVRLSTPCVAIDWNFSQRARCYQK